jgi:REP element-mobilizing transposase RayT
MPTGSPKQGRLSALRKGRFSEAYACYSITKVVNHRCPVLATPETSRILIGSWNYLQIANRIKLFAFCIMADHFHMTLCLMPGEDLSKIFEDSGKYTARELNKMLVRRGQFWADGFHDHRCRDEDDLHDMSLYIEHNPVRAGLVTAADLWPYSSAYAANRGMLDRDWWP